MKSFGRRTRIDQYDLNSNFLKTWDSIKENDLPDLGTSIERSMEQQLRIQLGTNGNVTTFILRNIQIT